MQTKTLQQLLRDFEEQMERELYEQDDHESVSSTEVEEQLAEQETSLEVSHILTAVPKKTRRTMGLQFLGRKSLSSFCVMIGSRQKK